MEDIYKKFEKLIQFSCAEKFFLNRDGLCDKYFKLFIIAVFLLFSESVYGQEQPSGDQGKQLLILTSFSPGFYAPFIEEFKAVRPDIKIQILNKKTTAALAEIIRGNARKFDLFWSSSPDAFVVLKDAGRLARSDFRYRYPPIRDLNGSGSLDGEWFHDFALSGIGFMWNQETLDTVGIALPENWEDLTDSRFYGHIAMSSPSRSGTNHLIVESILQDMGWNDGWGYLLRLASNMKTITARSFSVPDGVAGGRFGVGLVIDFLAFEKIHENVDNHFSYGDPTFLMPARIALLQEGQNRTESLEFIDFLLSPRGQKVLLRPSINRLPVSREVFSSYEIKIPSLISLIRQGNTRDYDTDLSTRRYELVNTLFDQIITYRLLDRKRIWKKIIELEDLYGKTDPRIIAVRQSVNDVLSMVPVTEKKSLEGALIELFRIGMPRYEKGEQRRKILAGWDDFVTEQLEKANEIIEEVTAEMASQNGAEKD